MTDESDEVEVIVYGYASGRFTVDREEWEEMSDEERESMAYQKFTRVATADEMDDYEEA